MELNDFLLTAKRSTYAAGGGKVAPCRPCSIDLEYREGAFRYLDSYFGGRRFSGQEIVYRDDKPVWSMNYYGFLQCANAPDGFSRALRQALLRVERQAPFRGPARFSIGAFQYACESTGELDQFRGEETIFFENLEIYRLLFHGGSVE
jgi:hypothetical protein